MNKLSLKAGVARLEDAIITVSGPCLAVSGIVAGVDLVTGGNILKSISWLALVWAITLLLTLDFQVLALGVQAHRIYAANNKNLWRKCGEIALAVLIAASISFVSIQMQSIIARVNAESIGIDQAAAQLGINTVWLIWERSSVVLVLIFTSGWLRHDTATDDAPPQPSLTDETMQLILARLAKIDALEQHLAAHVSVNEGVSTLQIAQVSASESISAFASAEQGVRKETIEHATTARFISKKEVIEAYVAEHPDASAEHVAHACGCDVRTAEKWMHQQQSGEPRKQ